jgi:hypothetical protein
MSKTQILLNLDTLDDIYRHYHDVFKYVVSTHREKLLTNDFVVILYDEVLENDKRVKKSRKEFEDIETYNDWLDEHYPSN